MTITNLGNLTDQIPQAFGPLTLDYLHFAVGRLSCKWSLLLTANTFNGRLSASFSYTEPFLNRQEAEQMVQVCMEKLTTLVY